MSVYISQLVMVIPLLSGTGMAAKYYADHEYITVSSQLQSEIRSLNREIRDLEYDRDNGNLTDKQLWELEQLRRMHEELEQQYRDSL